MIRKEGNEMKISMNNGRTYTNNIEDIDEGLATMGYDYAWLVSTLLPFLPVTITEKAHRMADNDRDYIKAILSLRGKDIAI